MVTQRDGGIRCRGGKHGTRTDRPSHLTPPAPFRTQRLKVPPRYDVTKVLRVRCVAVSGNEWSDCPEKELEDWSPAVDFMKAVGERPEYVCVSCTWRHYRENVKAFRLKVRKDSSFDCIESIWASGKIKMRNKLAREVAEGAIQLGRDTENMFLCKVCYGSVKSGKKHSARSIFNGMRIDETPVELACLNAFERPFVCKARCFQTVTHLAPLGCKLPHSDLVKAQKGHVLFYPVPISETLNCIGYLDEDVNFILYGVPTASRIVWKSLVDFGKIEKAAQCLKMNNPEYKDMIVVKRSLEKFSRSVESSVDDEDQCNLVEPLGIDLLNIEFILDNKIVHPVLLQQLDNKTLFVV